jgi:hypothetical protein
MRRPLFAVLALVLVSVALVARSASAPGTPTVTRYPVAAAHDDAWQRGIASGDEYAMDPDATIVFLGRSNSVDMKMSGGFRFVTTIAANTVVKAAFIQGLNDFGQQLTVTFYGDKTAGAPNFDLTNPSIVDRVHTTTNVPWNFASLQNARAASSPDLAPIINALDVLPGWNGTVVFLAIAGAGTDQSIDIRSFEHPVGPAATLEVQI